MTRTGAATPTRKSKTTSGWRYPLLWVWCWFEAASVAGAAEMASGARFPRSGAQAHRRRARSRQPTARKGRSPRSPLRDRGSAHLISIIFAAVLLGVLVPPHVQAASQGAGIVAAAREGIADKGGHALFIGSDPSTPTVDRLEARRETATGDLILVGNQPWTGPGAPGCEIADPPQNHILRCASGMYQGLVVKVFALNDRVEIQDSITFPTKQLGGPGRDLLEGGSGSDLIVGGGGGDRLVGRDGGDAMIGGDGSDRLSGGARADVLVGRDGGDHLNGGAGGDALGGGRGRDEVVGGPGSDLLLGGPGNDQCQGGPGIDILLSGC
jgi:RTX calcium-binding nonapeptide repeat (4 copies)